MALTNAVLQDMGGISMVETYSNSRYTDILTGTAAWDLTQQRDIPRLNSQQFLYVGTVMKGH
jgi:hypothetical protein